MHTCVFARRKEDLVMKQIYRLLVSATIAGVVALALVACGTETTARASAAQPQRASAVAQPAALAQADLLGTIINSIGDVKPIQDANLTFQVAGTVAQVLVK